MFVEKHLLWCKTSESCLAVELSSLDHITSLSREAKNFKETDVGGREARLTIRKLVEL